ncbi:hypothetical protein N2152v2_010743 [Parachlorella kessleri]
MESDEECEHGEWNLGFVEPPRRPTDVLRHRFPSKVGGRPAWLNPLHLPTAEQLACRATGKQLQFLLQVYAPVDANPAAFHRAVFVFVSPQGDKLSEPGAVRAYRCQLPRHNPFYPSEPPTAADVRPPPLSDSDMAAALARDPWRVAEHEQQQGPQRQRQKGKQEGQQQEAQQRQQQPPPQQQAGEAAAVPDSSSCSGDSGGSAPEVSDAQGGGQGGALATPRLLPELELIVEPEGEDEGGPGEDKLRELVQQYKLRTAEEGEYTEEELPSEVVDTVEAHLGEDQRHFAAFSARVGREPSQCLRYCFEPGASPLWPSLKRVPGPGDVPPCERCGAERRFEFQVMPQLLNYLDQDPSDPASLDWGMIAVYSCSASCGGALEGGEALSEEGSAYQEEFVWVQPS